MEFLYDKMLDSISTDVAAGMHRMIKTGSVPQSELMNPKSRREIYPSIHQSDQAMEESLQEYVTEVPPSKRIRRKASLEITSEHTTTEQEPTVESTDATEQQPSSTSMVTRGHHSTTTTTDIWGRIPPKEPKTTARCPVCSRHVSTSRFAPHLDKCMGIGSLSRAAAQNHTLISQNK